MSGPNDPPTILLAAVEPSADAIGAALIEALRARAPGIELIGCGGDAMTARGFRSAFPVSDLAVMGFTDVAGVYFKAVARARRLARLAAERRVDAAVFIDGWAFSRLCAPGFKARAPEARRIKLVAPQVWASRPQRVDFVRAYFDLVLALLPFEPVWFERAGVAAQFIGNPNFQAAHAAQGDGTAFRARHGLGAGPALGLLLGSRRHEVRRHAPVFAAAAQTLLERIDNLAIVVPAAPSVAALVREAAAEWTIEPMIVDADEKYDACAAMTAALAVSGTISTELAINQTPMAVAYRADPLTAYWARRVVTTPYASIVNVAADRAIVPEFIQEACTPQRLVDAVFPLLTNAGARAAQTDAFAPVLAELGVDGPPAADLAADAILKAVGVDYSAADAG